MDKPDALAIINFSAERYEIDLQGKSTRFSRNRIRRSGSPERREKLSRLMRMHQFIETGNREDSK